MEIFKPYRKTKLLIVSVIIWKYGFTLKPNWHTATNRDSFNGSFYKRFPCYLKITPLRWRWNFRAGQGDKTKEIQIIERTLNKQLNNLF